MTRDVQTLRARFPQLYSRDGRHRLTLGEVVGRVAEALDAATTEDSKHEAACDIIDRDFLFGAWGHRWEAFDFDLLRDIRGAIISAYERGKAKALSQEPRKA